MTALLLAPSVGHDLTGLVLLPVLSVILPIVFLLVVWYLGSRHTV